jgi:two-component system cell cycle sensor histidine kinase/response regulator CckA
VNLSSSTATNSAPLDEATYRLIFDCNPHAMWLFDEDTLDFLDVNQAAIDIYGYSREEFLTMKITQIRPPDDVARLTEFLRAAEPRASHVWTHLTKMGGRIDVHVTSTRATIDGRALRVAAVRDLSNGRLLEEQLQRDQRIETVGQLAGSVAHDFNNVLTAIIGHADLLSEYLAPDDPRAVEVDGIRSAADLATLLTRQLMAFSRNQLLDAAVLDLNGVVEHSRSILLRLVGDRIQLATDLSSSLMRVKVDPCQVEQILLNLVINSREAMPDGGRLTVRTRNVSVGADEARRLSVAEGDYVALSVADTGVGIDDRTRMHLFEPFFTTKDRVRGAGMGLATVYGIVKQSGGHIAVESDLGVGTTFTIFLKPTDEASGPNGLGRSRARTGQNGRTILLIEDDAAVRSLISEVLQRRGYRLLVAEGCAEALHLASTHDDPIDVVVTDAGMPGSGGVALTHRIREVLGDIPVLFITGDAGDTAMPGGALASAAFLRKPFTPDALVRKLRAVIKPPR